MAQPALPEDVVSEAVPVAPAEEGVAGGLFPVDNSLPGVPAGPPPAVAEPGPLPLPVATGSLEPEFLESPRTGNDRGDWQSLVTVVGMLLGAPPLAPPSTAGPAALLLGVEPPATGPPTSMPPAVVTEMHVQAEGQSESTLQVVALGWQ